MPPEVRALVGECELTGRHTIFVRNEKPVAILISHDEFLALRETIEVAADGDVREGIARAEREVERGALLLPEDLFEGMRDEG